MARVFALQPEQVSSVNASESKLSLVFCPRQHLYKFLGSNILPVTQNLQAAFFHGISHLATHVFSSLTYSNFDPRVYLQCKVLKCPCQNAVATHPVLAERPRQRRKSMFEVARSSTNVQTDSSLHCLQSSMTEGGILIIWNQPSV